jgi:hypothetical protein
MDGEKVYLAMRYGAFSVCKLLDMLLLSISSSRKHSSYFRKE